MAAQDVPASSFSLRPSPRSDNVERVEYPGRIVHIDRALATLGGSAELAKQFSAQNTGDVQLSLRLGLASSQPSASDAMHMTAFTSEPSASRGFLLSVTLDDSGSAVDATIAATYERTHSFNRLADFVYRRDSVSAASHIATPGVISGESPSLAQVARVVESDFLLFLTRDFAAGSFGTFQDAHSASVQLDGLCFSQHIFLPEN
jgi:hypothetical protein